MKEKKMKRLPYRKGKVAYVEKIEYKNDTKVHVSKMKPSLTYLCALVKNTQKKDKIESLSR